MNICEKHKKPFTDVWGGLCEDCLEESTTGTKLEDNPFAQFEDKADPFVPTATLNIYKYIDKTYQDFNQTHVNRASAATMCKARRWYQKNEYKGTPLTPRKRVNFFLGDLSELVMQHFIREGLLGTVYSEVDFGDEIGRFDINGKSIVIYKQKDLVTKVKDIEVTCHADGFGKRVSDGKWELIECKSAANWGFKGFQNEGAGDYLRQAHAVMKSDYAQELGVSETRYYYLRKETGHLWDRLEKFNKNIWQEVVKDFMEVERSKKPIPPQFEKTDYYPLEKVEGRKNRVRSKEPKGKTIGFPCTYCPYLEFCQGEYQVTWDGDQWGNKKPTYIFKE